MIPVALAKAMLQKNRAIPSAPVQEFYPSALSIGALFRACHRHAQLDRTLLEMAQLMTSAITAVPRDLLDPRSVGDAEIPRCPAIGFHQGSERLFDLALVAPLCPSACDGVPTLGQPTTAV